MGEVKPGEGFCCYLDEGELCDEYRRRVADELTRLTEKGGDIPMSNTCPCDVVELTEEEGRKFFDEVTRAELGMSGEEFLRRYDAGDFKGTDDPRVVGVSMLIPFARRVTYKS